MCAVICYAASENEYRHISSSSIALRGKKAAVMIFLPLKLSSHRIPSARQQKLTFKKYIVPLTMLASSYAQTLNRDDNAIEFAIGKKRSS